MGAEYDRASWERRWAEVVRDHPEAVSRRPPNHHLVGELAELAAGAALDAGCGHGADTLWLAARGWRVTAVDFAPSALEHGRATAESIGADVAGRVEWVAGDLSTWEPEPGRYQLVVSLYVHAADGVAAQVGRLAAGVAPGGTLLMVGHRPFDPATGAPTPAHGQVQVSVEEALDALDDERWDVLVAEERVRPTAGSGVDAVIRAVRRR